MSTEAYDPTTMECVFGYCGHTATHMVTVVYAPVGNAAGFQHGPRPYCRSCMRTEERLTRLGDSRVISTPIPVEVLA